MCRYCGGQGCLACPAPTTYTPPVFRASAFRDAEADTKNVLHPGLRADGAYLTIQERFEEWLETEAGRTIYQEFLWRAVSLVRRGWKHYGHKAIIESIRYDSAVAVGPNDGGFRINDHYSSRIARRAMAEEPELLGFFEVRELRA